MISMKKYDVLPSIRYVFLFVLVLQILLAVGCSSSGYASSSGKTENSLPQSSLILFDDENADSNDLFSEGSEHESNGPEDDEPLLNIQAEVGDIVIFGSYEQDNNPTNGKEPIEWIVLDKKTNGDYLLLSRYGLDVKDYHNKLEPVTWEDSSVRKWLNKDFLNTAFTSREQSSINLSLVPAEDNSKYGINAGNDTYDKVFLLSIGEAERYFVNDDPPSLTAKHYGISENGTSSVSRACYPTSYAISRFALQYEPNDIWVDYDDTFTGCCIWWLRSPGLTEQYAADVGYLGNIKESGFEVCRNGYTRRAIRPAIWIHSNT